MTIPLHTVPGSELPPLVWHHDEEEDAAQLVARFRPPLFDGHRSKPEGGLWAGVLRDYAGPYLSAWGAFSKEVGVKEAARYTSRIVPNPDARFVVIDSQADAAACAQAFPGVEGEGTLQQLLRSMGEAPAKPELPPDPSLDLGDVPPHLREAVLGMVRKEPLVDFTLLAQHQYAGVYLTDLGRMQTKYMSPANGIPSLWGWDVECVWFRAPELRVQDTSRWDPV